MRELRHDRSGQDHSFGELFGQLSQDMGLLVRQEAQLAKSELQQKISRAMRDLVSLATGGVVVLLGALALTAALILILAGPVGMRPWLAALLVGLVLATVGYVLLRRGLLDLKQTDPTPRRTVASIKEDIQWAKEQRP
jgi:hypothetical protein